MSNYYYSWYKYIESSWYNLPKDLQDFYENASSSKKWWCIIFELPPPFLFLAGSKNNLMRLCIFNLRRGYSGIFYFIFIFVLMKVILKAGNISFSKITSMFTFRICLWIKNSVSLVWSFKMMQGFLSENC